MASTEIDFAAFYRRVFLRESWPHQLEAQRSSAFITTIAAARRTGKTALAEAMATYTAFSNRGSKVLVLSATQDAARRITECIGARLAANQLTRGAVVDAYSTRITLVNGAQIVSLPASQRQVRGYGEGVLLVILDEAGFMPSELWTAAHYTALDERASGSRLLLLGTPWGGPEHFFRGRFLAGQSGDQDHASFQWTYLANPLLDAAYLSRQRDRVAPQEYAAEVLGEWGDAAGALFPWALLERNTADLDLPPLAEIAPPARPILGVDWGVSFDRSAAVAIYRLPVGSLNPDHDGRSVFVAVPHVWPVATPLSTVVDDVLSVRAWPRFYGLESSGVGSMPFQVVLRRVTERVRSLPRGNGPGKTEIIEIATTNAKKTTGYGGVLGLLEQVRLVLPRDPNLLRQLAGLRFEQRERGFTTIQAENPAVHDDVADALMLAALPHAPQGSSRVRAHLLKLAGRDVPEAEFGELDEEVIETGSGLRVYRRPPLQSVGGGLELTLPPDARSRAPGRPLEPTFAAARERVAAGLQRTPTERST